MDIRDIILWSSVGKLCFQEKRYEEAIDAFKHCLLVGNLEVNHWCDHALGYLVEAEIHLGRFSEARRYNVMLETFSPLKIRGAINELRIQKSEQNSK